MSGPGLGDRCVVEVGPVAHGGHCVARHDGQVIFVRHALPGEQVVVEVTGAGGGGRYLRADAIEVLRADPQRRQPPCPAWRECGGCDWQHATPAAARQLKAAVVREAFARFARLDLPADFAVAEVPLPEPRPAAPGLGWRTRAELSVDARGRAGFRGARSHDVVAVADCPQLDPRLGATGVLGRTWPPGGRIRAVAPAVGEPVVAEGRASGVVVERAAGRTWEVAVDGFWQVHPGAADALVEAVRRMLAVRPGESVVDLYSGVGLFGLSLADPGTSPDAGGDRAGAGAEQAGAPVSVTLVEGDRRACELARRNAAAARLGGVRVVRAPVDRWIARPGSLDGADVVVLDPPRSGAGTRVARAIATSGARAVAYVACDPVALARDAAALIGAGMGLAAIEALDLFPTTHHVECVALFQPMS